MSTFGLVGLYGVYFLFVGMNGNGKELKDNLSIDFKGFLPWLLAVIILKTLYDVDGLRPAVKPFIALALLTFTLRNYAVIIDQVNLITGLKLPNGVKK